MHLLAAPLSSLAPTLALEELDDVDVDVDVDDDDDDDDHGVC